LRGCVHKKSAMHSAEIGQWVSVPFTPFEVPVAVRRCTTHCLTAPWTELHGLPLLPFAVIALIGKLSSEPLLAAWHDNVLSKALYWEAIMTTQTKAGSLGWRSSRSRSQKHDGPAKQIDGPPRAFAKSQTHLPTFFSRLFFSTFLGVSR
jgi:hypothetical protein